MTKEEIFKEAFDGYHPSQYDGLHDVQKDRALHAMEVYAQPKYHWIKVEDELPPRHTLVNIADEHGVTVGSYQVDDWYTVEEKTTDSVTHWMPLPKPPNDTNHD